MNIEKLKNENHILLNDLLRLENLENVKIRLNKEDGDFDPIKLFKEKDEKAMGKLLEGQFWNHKKNYFKRGEIAIGLARTKDDKDKWLLFDISEITKDLNKPNVKGYEHKNNTKI